MLGWVNVDLNTADLFEPGCQYRFQSSHDSSRLYYPNVVTPISLLISQDDNWADNVYTPIELTIWNDQKRSLYNRMTNLVTGSHGTPAKIEKLCLPSHAIH
jgi:hypothetical protein